MTARTTQPRPSKGPLGERGPRLQERLGVVPLAAITRRGAVPVRLGCAPHGHVLRWRRRRQANLATLATQGWSRSPSPRTQQGMRPLICARFQPDWGKPNVRLIGGWEETGASRLCRAACGASRLPDHPVWSPERLSVEISLSVAGGPAGKGESTATPSLSHPAASDQRTAIGALSFDRRSSAAHNSIDPAGESPALGVVRLPR
jgi:hypothetical protein